MIRITGHFGHISRACEVLAAFQETTLASTIGKAKIGDWFVVGLLGDEPMVLMGPITVDERIDQTIFDLTPSLANNCYRAQVAGEDPGVMIEFNGREIRRGPHLDRAGRADALVREYMAATS